MPASGGTYRRRVKVLQVGYSKLHQDYIQKKRGEPGLFSFEYNILPILISNFYHYMDRALTYQIYLHRCMKMKLDFRIFLTLRCLVWGARPLSHFFHLLDWDCVVKEIKVSSVSQKLHGLALSFPRVWSQINQMV